MIAAVAAAVLTGLWFDWLFEGPVPPMVLRSHSIEDRLVLEPVDFGRGVPVRGQGPAFLGDRIEPPGVRKRP